MPDNVINLDAKRESKNAKRRAARAAKKTTSKVQDTNPPAPRVEEDTDFQPIVHPFRVDTKRRRCFDLLNRAQGATIEEGVKATKWPSNVVLSEFYEIAKACGAKVHRSTEAGTYHLTGGRR